MHFHLDFTEQLNRLAEAFHKYEIDEVKLAKYCQNDVEISTRRPRAASCTWPASPATWPSITRTGLSPRPSTQSWGVGIVWFYIQNKCSYVIFLIVHHLYLKDGRFNQHQSISGPLLPLRTATFMKMTSIFRYGRISAKLSQHIT